MNYNSLTISDLNAGFVVSSRELLACSLMQLSLIRIYGDEYVDLGPELGCLEYIDLKIISGKKLFVLGKCSVKKTHKRAWSSSSKPGSRCWWKWLLKAATWQVSARKAWGRRWVTAQRYGAGKAEKQSFSCSHRKASKQMTAATFSELKPDFNKKQPGECLLIKKMLNFS